MDNFHTYLKKQLVDYIVAERDKGVPLETIEKVLLDAGHGKNVLDEVFAELKIEEVGGEADEVDGEVENDFVANLKKAFSEFMAKANKQEIKDAKSDFKNTDTKEVVKEAIEEAEVIEEKLMFESLFFFIGLVVMSLVVLFSAGSTGAPIVNVVIGFFPAILNIFISFFAVSVADMVPLYVMIPLVISAIFYGASFSGYPLFRNFDMESLSIVNFIFGISYNVFMVYIRFLKPRHMKRRIIKKEMKNKEIIKPGIQKTEDKKENIVSKENEIKQMQEELKEHHEDKETDEHQKHHSHKNTHHTHHHEHTDEHDENLKNTKQTTTKAIKTPARRDEISDLKKEFKI